MMFVDISWLAKREEGKSRDSTNVIKPTENMQQIRAARE